MRKNLLVIGGKQGIGEMITTAAKAGHPGLEYEDVWAVSHDEVDVRQWDQLHALAVACDGLGDSELHIAYCAGINILGKIGELSCADVMEHYRVNVAGFIGVLDAFKMVMPNRKGVSITAIVSDSSRVPMRGSIMYASSKAAMVHAIRCAARELAPAWRVNGVSPGVVADTPMTDMVDEIVPKLRGWTLEEAQAYERSMIPMGRRARKDEVAAAVLWSLNGPEFMTGSIIDVAGGK